jgi:hypothetical protein
MTEYKTAIIIKAHGLLIPAEKDKIGTVPDNINILKPLPGVNIPGPIPDFVIKWVKEPTTIYRADFIRELVQNEYNNKSYDPAKPDLPLPIFYGNIYVPGENYTDSDIFFKKSQEYPDEAGEIGYVMHIKKNADESAVEVNDFRNNDTFNQNIFTAENLVSDALKAELGGSKGNWYRVKLSFLILLINYILGNSPYLLIDLACACIPDPKIADEIMELTLKGTSFIDFHRYLTTKYQVGGKYYKKYLKYKNKYLVLKKSIK